MNEVDFSSCRRIPGRAYNGANGEKINYVRFISDPPPDLKEALARIVPRIDLAQISAFIGEVPYLTDLQRDFYRTYLAARFAALFAAGGR